MRLVLAVLLLVSCGPPLLGVQCRAAGGQCKLGSIRCDGPAGPEDCNTNPPNPGGGHCCLPPK